MDSTQDSAGNIGWNGEDDRPGGNRAAWRIEHEGSGVLELGDASTSDDGVSGNRRYQRVDQLADAAG